jgi:hypothetical protein
LRPVRVADYWVWRWYEGYDDARESKCDRREQRYELALILEIVGIEFPFEMGY